MPTTREVLDQTIALERKTMALYARFARIFHGNQQLHEFWFNMARDEVRHVGALELVATVLQLEGVLERSSPVPMQDGDLTRLRQLLDDHLQASMDDLSLERALAVALEVEETELEDLVGDLLKALQQHDEYERCQRLLVHDLGELSYMIERHCQDAELLRRCDELVDHHAATLRSNASK